MCHLGSSLDACCLRALTGYSGLGMGQNSSSEFGTEWRSSGREDWFGWLAVSMCICCKLPLQLCITFINKERRTWKTFHWVLCQETALQALHQLKWPSATNSTIDSRKTLARVCIFESAASMWQQKRETVQFDLLSTWDWGKASGSGWEFPPETPLIQNGIQRHWQACPLPNAQSVILQGSAARW